MVFLVSSFLRKEWHPHVITLCGGLNEQSPINLGDLPTQSPVGTPVWGGVALPKEAVTRGAL